MMFPLKARKVAAIGLAGLTLAGAFVATTGEAEARWRRGGNAGAAVAAGIIGGLAVGALAASAARPAYGYPAPVYDYGPPPYAYGPGPAYYDYEPECFVKTRRVWVDGWGWRVRRVTVCD